MRTLRIPTNRNEITPELMADLIANLRKVCNLSGTGCTVNELPNGISIDVPPQKPSGFWAQLTGDPSGCGYEVVSNTETIEDADVVDQPAEADQTDNETENYQYYQWQAVTWQQDPTYGEDTEPQIPISSSSSTPTPSNNPGKPSSSTAYPSQDDATVYLIANRAREVNNTPTPAGTIVWLEPGTNYQIKVNIPGSGTGTGNQTLSCTEYTFSYARAAIQYSLWENLWMQPQDGVDPNPYGQLPGVALAFEMINTGTGNTIPLDVAGNPDLSRLILVVDPAVAYFESVNANGNPPTFIGLGQGYIAEPGDNTPEWTTPDTGWAVYYGVSDYGGRVLRGDGQTRIFPVYVAIGGRSPQMQFGVKSDAVGPRCSEVEVAGGGGTILVSDPGWYLPAWYPNEDTVGEALWSLEASTAASKNIWLALYVYEATAGAVDSQIRFINAVADGGFVSAGDPVTIKDCPNGMTQAYNYLGLNANDGDLLTLFQTGIGDAYDDPAEWLVVAVEHVGFTGGFTVDGTTYHVQNGVITFTT